jgi:hypothetical protein
MKIMAHRFSHFAIVVSLATCVPPNAKPNVLFIAVDDLARNSVATATSNANAAAHR